jgi:hypothetical protein
MPVQEVVGCHRECRSSHLWNERPPLTKEEEQPGGPCYAAGLEVPSDRLMLMPMMDQ